jgi:hypothetical protein
MRAITLPFDEEQKALAAECDRLRRTGDEARADESAKELAQRTHAAVMELMQNRGWQLVLGMMREVVDAALSSIADGQRPEFHAGEISAIERIRQRLRELTDPPIFPEAYDERLTNA